ncbi:MAG: hypothetical protein Tsb0027_21110 [Wenzhouxiangellaceae bacterium]
MSNATVLGIVEMKPGCRIFIALDFETTGLDPQYSRIVELGAVKFNSNGEVIDMFKTFANPGIKIPKVATDKHGITESMIRGAPTPFEAWESFLEWANEINIIFAHNAQYEASFIKALYIGRDDLPNLILVDTLRASRLRLKDETSYRLSSLVEEYEGSIHRALPDAKACAKLYSRISSTYKNGVFPIKTYSKQLHEYPLVEPPTRKQISYIDHLGGDV